MKIETDIAMPGAEYERFLCLNGEFYGRGLDSLKHSAYERRVETKTAC